MTNGLRNFSCIGPSLTVEVSEKGVTESVKFGWTRAKYRLIYALEDSWITAVNLPQTLSYKMQETVLMSSEYNR